MRCEPPNASNPKITDTFSPDINGVARTLKHFTDYLDDNHIPYKVFAPNSHSDEYVTKQIRHLKSFPFFLYPDCRLAFPNLLKIKAELQQFSLDIIHVATPFNVGLCGIYLAKKLNIPLVGSYHTDFDYYLQFYNLQFLSKILSGFNFLHLFIWSFLAVILHVLLDLLNVDGTQILLPFSRKWIAFDAIPLFDPYILLLHFLGFGFLPFLHGGKTFLIIYVFLFLYLCLRFISTVLIKKYLQFYFLNAIQIKLIPRMELFKWDIIIETQEDFIFGVYSENSLRVEHTLAKKIDFQELVKASKDNDAVSDFLSATDFAYPFVQKYKKVLKKLKNTRTPV